MARKKLVEHNALVQAIEMGTSKARIMEDFGFKDSTALHAAYYNALVALGKIEGVKKERKKKKVNTRISINSRGSLVVPKELVDYLELDPDAQYDVVKNGSDLILKKSAKPPKTILRKGANSPKYGVVSQNPI
ncbi:hypothetical protein JCM12296A_53800 [Desulfosarcina cetonica]|uniref:hypothetical protein n=1 Tax=Desulfosarcina cetonica TaxID=90730 RepID=UPI0006D1C383|nr:hypothetical protein [Desulfosarcina cetonica]